MKIIKTTFLSLLALQLTACVSESRYVESGKPIIKHQANPVGIAKNRMALGLQYIKVGDYAQAKFNLDKAVEEAPDMPEVHYSLAYYYQVVNELKHADASYKKVLELDPENANALNNYGAFLCQYGDIDKAEENFLKALAQDKYIGKSKTYVNLGVCMLENGREEGAIKYLNKALSHDPYSGKALIELADYNFKHDEVVAAKGYLKRFEKNSRLSARSLWLAYQVEKELSNLLEAKHYGEMLIRYHPKSLETQELKKLID